ncbi:MAG: NAD(P)-dependent oxidoreductase [Chloroflexota bacterium]
MSNPTKVLVTDPDFGGAVPQVAGNYPDMAFVAASEDTSAADRADDTITAVVTAMAPVDAVLLDALPNLQVIVKMGRSYHNIDMDAARARNITLASAPRKGPNCVAELALTFIMSLSKDLLASHESVATGAYRYRGLKPEITAQWKMAFHWMKNQNVHEVESKTLGIIGMGEIGCELARRASVMGMRTVYYKRTPLSAELERRFDAAYRDLDALLAESDYVCVAAPHTPATEGMIGAEQLAMMKETAYIVNIARGGLIDEDALIDALTNRHIAGAGLDVFTYEPLSEDSPLCQLDNVMMTPHIGGGTGTNRPLELGASLDELQRILAGEPPRVDLSQPV